LGRRLVANTIQTKAADLDQERKAFDEAFTMLGRTLAASQNLIAISGENSDPEKRTDLIATAKDSAERKSQKQKDLQYLKSEIDSTREAYETTNLEWQVQQVRLGIVLAARHPYPDAVNASWYRVSESVERFRSCAYNIYENDFPRERDDQLKTKCEQKRKCVQERISDLSKLLFHPSSIRPLVEQDPNCR
jgi:hypothetical protein